MKMNNLKWLAIFCIVSALNACSTFTGVGKDNTPAPSPLVNYQSQLTPKLVWSNDASNGIGKDYSNVTLAYDDNKIFSADTKGYLTSNDVNDGKVLWQTNLKAPLIAGPSASNGVVLIASNNADLFALSEATGKEIWHIVLSDPVIASPAISGNTAIIKTIDSQLWAISLSDGKVLWRYNHGGPGLILAGGSKPFIVNNTVITGYSDGKLSAYTLDQGKLLWETQISQASGASDVEQLVDIVADPLLQGNTIYVVAYQGNLAAVNLSTGDIEWQQPLSSFTGMAITNDAIIVTDQQSDIWAFNHDNGQVLWHQTNLRYRQLTAPVIAQNVILVADGQGYLHCLNLLNGQTIGRVEVSSGTSIVAKPLVLGNSIFIITSKGNLKRYQI